MNKITITPLLCLGAWLAACQSTEAPNEASAPTDKQIINITVSDVQASRGGRELVSAEAGQSVDNVTIILVDSEDKVVWTKLCDNWQTIDAEVSEYGRRVTIEIPKDEFRMLSGAQYHAYAIGYSDDSDYDLTYYTACKVNDSFAADHSIRLKNASAQAEEIFAGDCVATGTVDGVRMDLALNRQVAGTYGYMTKIPYVKDRKGNVGIYLILAASNAQSAMRLGMYDNIGISASYTGNNVVNGIAASESSVVYSINLHDWFGRITEQRDASGSTNGLIVVEDNWKGDKSRYREGSVFAGAYIIPFAKTERPSLQLHLCYDNDLSTSIRTWNVLLPDEAPQLANYTLWTPAEAGWTSAEVTDDIRVYNVLRNQLYAIGNKQSDILPGYNPDEPDATLPDDPTDEPEPINNKQELSVMVNHAWSNIFNMGIE